MQHINLAHHTSIGRWEPEVGDFVTWHGWFTHWFGVVSEVRDDEVTIIKAGMPYLLFALTQSEYDKNKETVSLATIRAGGSLWGGKYAAIKSNRTGIIVWFV